MKASDVGQGKWPVIMAMGEAWGGSSQDTDVEGSPTSLRDSEVRGGEKTHMGLCAAPLVSSG